MRNSSWAAGTMNSFTLTCARWGHQPPHQAARSQAGGCPTQYVLRWPNAVMVLESNVRRGARTTRPTRARLPPATFHFKPENARQTPELMVTKGTFGRQGTALQFANDHKT